MCVGRTNPSGEDSCAAEELRDRRLVGAVSHDGQLQPIRTAVCASQRPGGRGGHELESAHGEQRLQQPMRRPGRVGL